LNLAAPGTNLDLVSRGEEYVMKIISILLGLSMKPSDDSCECRADWLRDPLAHPALDSMSERELADLAFSRSFERDRAECAA
jgi:uncharacterized protein YjiS (DUF1127 family)